MIRFAKQQLVRLVALFGLAAYCIGFPLVRPWRSKFKPPLWVDFKLGALPIWHALKRGAL